MASLACQYCSLDCRVRSPNLAFITLARRNKDNGSDINRNTDAPAQELWLSLLAVACFPSWQHLSCMKIILTLLLSTYLRWRALFSIVFSFQAIKCCLADLPQSVGVWTPDAVLWLRDSVLNCSDCSIKVSHLNGLDKWELVSQKDSFGFCERILSSCKLMFSHLTHFCS